MKLCRSKFMVTCMHETHEINHLLTHLNGTTYSTVFNFTQYSISIKSHCSSELSIFFMYIIITTSIVRQ
jgi:hypothetical protein